MSSDGVTLKVCKKYFELATSSFPYSESVTDDRDPVRLEETAEILEILFQFIHPPTAQEWRHPSVVTMKKSTFFAVSEAAEKYIVFAAMNVFATRMY